MDIFKDSWIKYFFDKKSVHMKRIERSFVGKYKRYELIKFDYKEKIFKKTTGALELSPECVIIYPGEPVTQDEILSDDLDDNITCYKLFIDNETVYVLASYLDNILHISFLDETIIDHQYEPIGTPVESFDYLGKNEDDQINKLEEYKNKKYLILPATKINYCGINLYRIYRLRDRKLGGWVQNEENLDQHGECWIDINAIVFGNSKVKNNAKVSGDAVVCDSLILGNAIVTDNAFVNKSTISGDAYIANNACVLNIIANKNSKIVDNAKATNISISDSASLLGDADVVMILEENKNKINIDGSAKISSRIMTLDMNISGSTTIDTSLSIDGVNLEITGNVTITNNAKIFGNNIVISGNTKLSGNCNIDTENTGTIEIKDSNISDNVSIFAGDMLIDKCNLSGDVALEGNKKFINKTLSKMTDDMLLQLSDEEKELIEGIWQIESEIAEFNSSSSTDIDSFFNNISIESYRSEASLLRDVFNTNIDFNYSGLYKQIQKDKQTRTNKIAFKFIYNLNTDITEIGRKSIILKSVDHYREEYLKMLNLIIVSKPMYMGRAKTDEDKQILEEEFNRLNKLRDSLR